MNTKAVKKAPADEGLSRRNFLRTSATGLTCPRSMYHL
jgi:hypothetical protein